MFALLQGPTQLACWMFSRLMRQFLNTFPLREGGGQRPGWMCLIEAQICAADSSFSFLRLSHKSPYRFEDPSCAFGAPLLQGPTQLARWTFSHPMRQFLNAFPLREGGGQRPGWMCLIEAQICAADSSFSFLRLSHKSPYRFEDPSCAFGAALLQGPTRGGLSNIYFHAAYRIVSCSIVMLTRPRRYATIARRVRLWRRAYSRGTVRHWLSYRRQLTICLLF